MNSLIYNPLEEYEKKIKDIHNEKTKALLKISQNTEREMQGMMKPETKLTVR